MDLLLNPHTLSLLGITSEHVRVLLAILGLAGAIGAAFAILWAAIKIAYTKASGKPFPNTPFTRKVDLVLQVVMNIPGAINKARKDAGKPSLFPPSSSSESGSTPPPSP